MYVAATYIDLLLGIQNMLTASNPQNRIAHTVLWGCIDSAVQTFCKLIAEIWECGEVQWGKKLEQLPQIIIQLCCVHLCYGCC